MDSECQVLIEEIVNLEGRLSISSTDVVNTKQPVSSNFVHYLRNELKRLKELRLKNLRTIILKCQTELVDWWENCLVGGDARDSRLTSANQEMNESLLTSLELEIAKWKAFYSRNEPFFKAVESWQCVLSRLRMSEQKMKDPSVLKNRGGILLVIDKEIKQLRRDLSRQYSILRELSCSFPDVKVHGFSVLDYLDNAEQQYNVLGKENQVAQNMSGRDFSVSYMKTGISAKRTLNANKLQLRTPPSSKKRCIGPSNNAKHLQDKFFVEINKLFHRTEFGSKFNLNTCLSQNLTCSSMISLTGSGSANTLSTAHTPITKVKVSVKTPVAFKVPSVSSISSSQKKTILSTPKPRRSGRLNGKKMCSTSRVPQRSPRSVNHSGTSVSNQIKRTARWT
ncbi:unnamed protein product [Heterobilharzia americana]|nr:unnamed protein product [Heterobilharzia americana]